jgi:hypothetical protein
MSVQRSGERKLKMIRRNRRKRSQLRRRGSLEKGGKGDGKGGHERNDNRAFISQTAMLCTIVYSTK